MHWWEPGGEPGWLEVTEPEPSGFAEVGDDGDELFEDLEPRQRWGAHVIALAGGPEGLTVVVAMPHDEADGRRDYDFRSAWSADGQRWEFTERPLIDWRPPAQAWGPVGWLSVATTGLDESASVWHSADGRHWKLLGLMPDLNASEPVTLVASDRGYLLFTRPDGSVGIEIWHSVDGTRWLEGRAPHFVPRMEARVTAAPIGYYAWADVPYLGFRQQVDEARFSAEGAFSIDGREWSPVDDAPGPMMVGVAGHEDRLLAVDLGPSGESRAWRATVSGGRLTWLRDEASDDAFAGATVSALAGDERQAMAFGWELATERPLAWRYEGDQWRRSELPVELNVLPRLAALGRDGFVVVGHRPTLSASNPIFWHQTDGGGWAPETEPLLPLTPDARPGDCPAPPLDFVSFVQLDRPTAVVCFGDQPLTFRAWAVRCDGCRWEAAGAYEPAWLAEAGTNLLHLAGIGQSSSWMTSVVLHPTLGEATKWSNRWVELTGHFDDPDAASCRHSMGSRALPTMMDRLSYPGRQATVNGCRISFVVTAVAEVDGP